MEPTLPLDVLLYIIDLLAARDDRDSIRSLQILSQACKSMVPLCRKHLFSSISLISDSSLERFGDLLSKNPDIARYVRSLDYRVFNPISDHELIILDILRERSSLQSIELSSPRLYWNTLPESIRSSLVSLIQLPTVTHLDIDSFRRFPATALSGCSNLIVLQLGELYLDPSESEVNQVISRSKIPTPLSLNIRAKTHGLATFLKSASSHEVGPIVDLSRLQKAHFEVETRGDISQLYMLIMATTQLEYLNITMNRPVHLIGLGGILAISAYQTSMNRPVELNGLGESLAINAYRTLKSLELGIPVVGDDYDPLCGLSRELGIISGNNILEELRLYVVIRDAACQSESEDWSAFDSVLTKSGAFPSLHRVSVGIWWYSTVGNDQVDQVALLESLKEEKFSRLVESKAVEFNFSAQIYSHDTQ